MFTRSTLLLCSLLLLVSCVDEGTPITTPTPTPTVTISEPQKELSRFTPTQEISTATDIDSSCRYSVNDNLEFELMQNPFSVTGGTVHSTEVAVLPEQHYDIYISCDNSKTVLVSFFTEAKESQALLSNAFPTGLLAEYSTEQTISLTSNIAVSCRYGLEALPYVQLPFSFTASANGLEHQSHFSVEENQQYQIFTKCVDSNKNESAVLAINFTSNSQAASEDMTTALVAPILSNVLPQGKQEHFAPLQLLSLQTNEAANCRYSLNDTSYSKMIYAFIHNADGTKHQSDFSVQQNGFYTLYARCIDPDKNESESFVIQFTTATTSIPADLQAPVLENALPKGELEQYQTMQIMSVSTNENASCRYATENVLFNQMSLGFTPNENGLDHQVTLAVSPGEHYSFYLRCLDASSNESEPLQLDFTAAINEKTDNSGPLIKNVLPNGQLTTYITSQKISLITDESAICRFDEQDKPFENMIQNFTADTLNIKHQAFYSVEAKQEYKLHVRCVDNENNEATNIILFHTAELESKPAPSLTEGAPSGTLYFFENPERISLKTNEQATCRYSKSNTDFAQMSLGFYPYNNGTNHESWLSIEASSSYTIYVRCIDLDANESDTLEISFITSIDQSRDIEAPILTEALPVGEISDFNFIETISIQTNETSRCRYGLQDLSFNELEFLLTSNNTGLSHQYDMPVEPETNYLIYARCIDLSNNESESMELRFTTAKNEADDTKAPLLSSGLPSGVLETINSQELISFHTDEAASCRYAEQNISYELMTETLQAINNETTHQQAFPVAPSVTYNLYARCIDSTGNESDPLNIEFTTAAIPSVPGFLIHWQTPESRVNGQSFSTSEISKFIIRYKAKNEESYTEISIEDTSATQYFIESQESENYEVMIQVMDLEGLSSVFSPTVTRGTE